MKNIFKFLVFGLIAVMLFSCEKDEDQAVLQKPSASTLKADKATLVLIKDAKLIITLKNYYATLKVTYKEYG